VDRRADGEMGGSDHLHGGPTIIGRRRTTISSRPSGVSRDGTAAGRVLPTVQSMTNHTTTRTARLYCVVN
jgi:hypothetical protein